MRLYSVRCSRVCFLCVTWQRDALLVARLPLAVLVHRAALAAGLLVADKCRVIFGADFILHDGSLEGGENSDISVWKSEVNISAGRGGPFLTVEAVQLLPRDTHWPEHHWQPLVFAVQL